MDRNEVEEVRQRYERRKQSGLVKKNETYHYYIYRIRFDRYIKYIEIENGCAKETKHF